MCKLNADALEEVKYWPLEFLRFSLEQDITVNRCHYFERSWPPKYHVACLFGDDRLLDALSKTSLVGSRLGGCSRQP
jgi:hypothetical protein